MSTIAIIAALDRELHPLVKGWKSTALSQGKRDYRVYEYDNVVAVAGGIGCVAAQAAAQAIVTKFRPQVLLSVGLAGALIRSLKVANVITPNVIVDAGTGCEYRCESGGGVLVTAGEIADSNSKQQLVERFHALAVDMEAAGVASVAAQEQVGFHCVKAISDEADFSMPPLNRFVDEDGNLQTGKFAAWASVRPAVWPRMIALGRNSSRAAQALCHWLQQNLATGLQPARVVKVSDSTGSASIGHTLSVET